MNKMHLSKTDAQAIAAGTMAGKPAAVIARETGLNRGTVTRWKQHPAVQSLMRELAARHEEKIDAAYGAIWDTLIDDMAKTEAIDDTAKRIKARQSLRAEVAQLVAIRDNTMDASNLSGGKGPVSLDKLLQIQILALQQTEGDSAPAGALGPVYELEGGTEDDQA